MTRTTYKRRPGRARRIETALETALGTAGRRATLAIRHARWRCITVYPITVRVVFWTAFAAVLAGIVVAAIVVDERWYLAAILLAAPVIIGHSVWMDYYLATRCRCDKCEGVRR